MITLNKYSRANGIEYGNSKNFNQLQAIGPELIEYPFEGDIDSILLHQDYKIYSDYYPDSVPALGTAHPSYPGLFFVKDSNPSNERGAIVTFTRTWGMLPGFVVDNQGNATAGGRARIDFELFTWTKPGIDTFGDIVLWKVDNTQTSFPASNQVKLYTQYKAGPSERWQHDITTDFTKIQVQYLIKDATITSLEYNSRIFTENVTLVEAGTDYVIVERPKYNTSDSDQTITFIYFSVPQIDVNSQQKNVNSRIEYKYYLPGVNCKSIEDVELEEPFGIVDSYENETDKLSVNSDPSLAEFKAMITAGTEILVEINKKRWLGPIYEVMRRYVKCV